MKTLHEKLIELSSDGIDVMFKPFKSGDFMAKTHHMQIVFRYQPSGSSVKTENSKSLTMLQMENEQFLVSLLEEMYQEMKPHIFPYNEKVND
jgi:hypothetical protein